MNKPVLRPALNYSRGHCVQGHPIDRHSTMGSVGDLTAMRLTGEQTEVLERQALEVFTLMANSGRPFATCLSSILLTGMQWGSAMSASKGGEP